MKVIASALRAMGKIVLCCATTGLAALNHEGGSTVHATYKIPVTETDKAPQCNVTPASQQGELLCNAALNIWDEFPMAHRKNLEAVNCLLCDLTQNLAPCGGKVFLCCGDFHQIPPVIPGGTRALIVHATIKASLLWTSFFKCNLTHAQCDAKDATYSSFVDKIGDELEASYSACSETSLVKLDHINVTLSVENAIAFVHPDINDAYACSKSGFLTGTNQVGRRSMSRS